MRTLNARLIVVRTVFRFRNLVRIVNCGFSRQVGSESEDVAVQGFHPDVSIVVSPVRDAAGQENPMVSS